MGVQGEPPGIRPSRRSLLAGTAAMASTAGCIQRLQSLGSGRTADPVGFEIKTLPADEDPFAMVLARRLAQWFQAAGIDASVLPVTGDELLRQVLIAGDFDAFVAQYPVGMSDPDEFYALVHSSYAAEDGWQNPFGYSSLSTDEALERQRTTAGADRRDAVRSLQETLLEQNPFTVLAFTDRIAAAREDRYEGLVNADLRDQRSYFALERVDPDAKTLTLATTDFRPMTNLNPLNPEYRRDGLVTGFLYEPLAYGDGDVSWLAADTSWRVEGENPVVEVTLRDGLEWHDGTALTASDVTFTHRFLNDTALGEHEHAQPATRYRGRSSLVDTTAVPDERTVNIRFDECTREVARRTLTLPVLPEHVWDDRSSIDGGGEAGTTTAVVTDNVPPVGSGPLAFERASKRQQLVLSTVEDHFTRGTATNLPAPYRDGLDFEELVLRFASSDASAVELVSNGDADATVTNVGTDVVPRIGRHDDINLGVTSTDSFYFAGYNTRRPPFSNTRFRQLLARLVDRSALVASVFEGYATPAVSPLASSDWLPAEFAWDGRASTTPFLGENGTVDVDRTREAFAEAGYRYDDQGRLLEH